jgi:hypothetical protein
MTPEQWAEQLRKLARTQPNGQLYIDEAEHQDGDEYWEQFKTEQELLTDMALFNKCLKDAEEP